MSWENICIWNSLLISFDKVIEKKGKLKFMKYYKYFK